MTVSEYINKVHEWVKDIGPEDEVEITPSRLLFIYNTKDWKSLIHYFYTGYDNN